MGHKLHTEDRRIAQARQLLTESYAIEHRGDGQGAARMWSRLESALDDVLAFVDETGRAGQLDRIEKDVAELKKAITEEAAARHADD